MTERWDCMAVVCIEPIEGLRVGSTYNVKGRGNLEYNAATDKKGWGLCLEDDWLGALMKTTILLKMLGNENMRKEPDGSI